MKISKPQRQTKYHYEIQRNNSFEGIKDYNFITTE